MGSILMTLITSATNAQESNFGIKGGLNLSYLMIDDVAENNLVTGFHVGVFGRTMLTENAGLQADLLFSSQGAKTVYNSEFLGFDVAEGETKLNTGYINVPLKFVFNLNDKINLQIGPYIGFLLNAKYESDNEVLGFIDVENEDDIEKDEFNEFDFGLTGNIEFNVDPLLIGASYNYGLQKVAAEGDAMEDLIDDATNQVVQVYIGLLF